MLCFVCDFPFAPCMFVRYRDRFRLGLSACRAGIGLDSRILARRLRCHFAVNPCVSCGFFLAADRTGMLMVRFVVLFP